MQEQLKKKKKKRKKKQEEEHDRPCSCMHAHDKSHKDHSERDRSQAREI